MQQYIPAWNHEKYNWCTTSIPVYFSFYDVTPSQISVIDRIWQHKHKWKRNRYCNIRNVVYFKFMWINTVAIDSDRSLTYTLKFLCGMFLTPPRGPCHSSGRESPGFPPRWPGFEPRSGHVGFVVYKVALEQVFFEYFGFPLPILIPPTDPHTSTSIIWDWCNRLISGWRTK
jgi:hypothetical protein